MKSLIVFIVVAVVMASVPVEALRTEATDQVVYIDPDPDEMEFNETYNASAPEARSLSNYNVSAVPFMNASGVSGTFTGPFTPPLFYKVAEETNWTNDRVSTIVRFKSEEVMSGSSVSWWRCPALGLKGNDTNFTVLFRIWHVDSPGLLDSDIVGDLYDNEPNMARTTIVFGRAYGKSAVYGGAANVTYYWQNYTAGDAWDYSDSGTNLSFLWLRVDAMIHADESYLVDWEMWSAEDHLEGEGKRLTFTACDVGDNGIYKTWLKFNASTVLTECDLDVSVVHQYGIGHSVSGWPVEPPVADGGGGGDTGRYRPSDFDAMTDSLTPTGTVDGGIWDGDWATTGSAAVGLDAVKVVEGANSIRATTISTNDQLHYTLDVGFDVTDYDLLTFSYYPDTSTVRSFQIWVYLPPPSVGYRYKSIGPFNQDAWNTVEIPLWSGWSSGGAPDYSDMGKIMFYFNSATTGQIANVDKMFFTDEDADEPGPGGDDSYTTLIMYDTLEDPPDEVDDYVTFFMPFMFPVDNSSNVEVTIRTTNSTWSESFWVAENGPCDFAIKSFAWGESWAADTFYVKVRFYNASNVIYVHDDNADYDPWYGAGTPYSNNYFLLRTSDPNMTVYGNVFYRPYHSLQTTDGEWVNTQVPDDIIFGGRYVNMSDLQMRDEAHTPPLAIRILHSWFVIYDFVDKVIFNDLLPNLDEEHFYKWMSQGLQNIKDTYWLINAKVAAFVEVVRTFVEAAGRALAAIVQGAILFFSVLVFVVVCLYTNGVKNFFVVGAKYGTVAMGDYAIGFFKKSFSFKSFGRWD